MAYNEKYELIPIGFDNMGATCYFNAVLQSMLSCTSFVQEMLSYKDDGNPMMQKIAKLITCTAGNEAGNEAGFEDCFEDCSSYSIAIWKSMISFLCKKNNITKRDFMTGQQCAREGFHCLMDAMESYNNIQNLFLHRYSNMIRCGECNKWVSNVDSMNNLFTVHPELKAEQLEQFKKFDSDEVDMAQFLSKQTGYVESFTCPKCKSNEPKYNVNCLVMVPEILVVLSKKYKAGQKLDLYTNFPKTLVFKGTNNTKLIYNAVSQIEHSGGLNGGHYWAISKRAGGWYQLNDNHVSKAEFNPTKDTYMVFYHLM